jgi:hypothetical protein
VFAHVSPTTAQPSISTPRLVALVALVLLAVCLVAFAASELLKHTRRTTTTLPRHVERVVVEAGSGDVRLQGGEGNRVVVEQDLQWLWRRPTVSMRVVGSVLRIASSCPTGGPVNRCKADLRLTIPFDADVKVTGDAGDIRAERLAGHLELDTDDGDIRGADLNPVSIQANTQAGDVRLEFSTQPVSVAATSKAGDVLLDLPAGGDFRVDATTNAGDVEVSGLVRNDRALRSIAATTDAGDVRVQGHA